MKKRIYRISEDKFDEIKPNIEISTTYFEDSCIEGSAYEGKFVIRSLNGISARGVVYCDCPYVTVLTPQFDGEISTICFSLPDLHMLASETVEGVFTVVTVGAEISVPFKITYIKPKLVTSVGVIDSMQAFADFAQSRFSEAVNVFYSDAFYDFVETLDEDTRLLYRGFRNASLSPVNLDEFLVSCHYKPSMRFDLNERHEDYYGVTENLRGEIEIIRNTWGVIDIEVKCDSDFVSVEKENITSDFFLGSVFNMNYYIHKEKMHAGKNYAKITFDFHDCHKEITIMATQIPEGVERMSKQHEQSKMLLTLLRDYEEFRLRRLPISTWSASTLELLEKFTTDIFSENQLLLYKALIYITNGQRQEALWIIQDLKRTIENKRGFEWAFLLYLCTLIEPEEAYVDRLTEDIEGIFKENEDNTGIFWFLLFLRKEYIKNASLKLHDISEWIMAGREVSALYIEAYFVFVQNPYLIADFDDFTLKVLHWAKKHNAITKDMSIQMIHVLESQQDYKAETIDILEVCYEKYQDLHLLLSMVTYMLKAPVVEERFFKWIRLAMDSNLHIPGLYEAYMKTVSLQSVEQLPQLVTMYFRYNNELPYERKALLYANIILHKDDDPETYSNYERTIEKFSMEQLRQGHLDDNLAICYQQLLKIGVLDDDLAKLLVSYIFRKKIAVLDPNIKRVFLYQEEFKNPTVALVEDHQAYLLYMGSKGKIFLEDIYGRVISDENAYLIEDIMNPMDHLKQIKALAPDAFPFVMQDILSKKQVGDFSRDDIEAVELMLQSPQISTDYRSKLYPLFIEFLRYVNREDIIEQHFMHEVNLHLLPASIVGQLVEVLQVRCKFDQAYKLLQETCCFNVAEDCLTKLCRYMINQVNNESDDFLISLTAMLASRGIMHKDMLYYLLLNYVGPTPLMVDIFIEAHERGLDIVEFAERILVQSLYRDIMPENIMQIFDAYIVRKNNKMIVEAFLTYQAHSYLTYGTKIPEEVFAYIFNRIKKALDVNDSMRIALLKYLCLADNLEAEDLDMLDMLMADAVFRNQYFGFFSKCKCDILMKYHLYDKYFVEYRAERHSLVTISYSINGGPVMEEELIEMYDGLFVKEFVVFFGDELTYDIYVSKVSKKPVFSDKYIASDMSTEISDGRFAIMNNLSRLKIYHDKEELAKNLKRYQGLDVVSRELFTTIM